MGKSKGKGTSKKPPVAKPAEEEAVDQAPSLTQEPPPPAQPAQAPAAVSQASTDQSTAAHPLGGEPPSNLPAQQLPNAQSPSASPKEAKASTGKILWLLLDFVLCVFWTYLLAKLFIIDVDTRFVEWIAPQYVWLLDYKLVIYLLALVFLFLRLGTPYALLFIGYALVFPLLLLLWKLPKLIVRQKSWVLILAVVNSLLSFFRSIRRRVIFGGVWLVCTIIAFSAQTPILLVPSILGLIALLTLIYWDAFVSVFRPSPVYQLYGKMLFKLRTAFTDANKDTPDKQRIRGIPIVSLSEDDRKLWVQVMEPLVLYNRGCLFVARKLREYQNSGVGIFSGTLRIIWILFVTTLTMAAANYAVYVLHPSAFDVSSTPTRFTFFFYSVSGFAHNFIKEITPASMLAQGLWILGFFFALLLATMLISLIFTERARRQDDQMKSAISEIEAEGAAMETFILQNYRVQSIDDAMSELERVKSGLMQIMLFLSRHL